MRLYRALLYLYPAYFRNEYRAQLVRDFAERTAGWSAWARTWPALADVIPAALAVRWDHLRQNTAAAATQPTLGVDVTLAVRQMRRTPLFATVVIAVLGLGIGINAAMFTMLDSYAWKPAPGIPRDADLARLLVQTTRGEGRALRESRLSTADLAALRARRDVFASVAAWAPAGLAADFGRGAEVFEGQYVSENYFAVLGVGVVAGRAVLPEDDPAAAQSVVIGHSVWTAFFGGSDTVIGATIRIQGLPFTVVGVAPRRFIGTDILDLGDHALFLPLSARALLEPHADGEAARRTQPWLDAGARLAEGVRSADVEPRIASLAAQLVRARQLDAGARLVIGAERLTGISRVDNDRGEIALAFLIVCALVMLITCTNVGALLLGRAVDRRREIGVRLSLGASRLRLVRQLLSESLVYAVCGALLGVALFYAAARVVQVVSPVHGFDATPTTFIYAGAAVLVATLLMGLAPALHATRADIGEVIKSGGHHAVRRSRLQSLFVVAQLACSQPVLVLTALVLASLRQYAGGAAVPAPATIVTTQAVVLRPAPPDSGVAEREGLLRVVQRLLEEPGVRGAALSLGGGTSDRIRQVYVTPGFFAAVQMPLVLGRSFTRAEQGRPLAVVTDQAARVLWPGENPLGKRIERRLGYEAPPVTFEVVGMVRHAEHDPRESRAELFVPFGFVPREYSYGARLTVRTAGDARASVPRLREVIREAEPYAALHEVYTLAEQAEVQRQDARVSHLVGFAVSAAALLLASLGLYAIIAYSVAQRTREIGVRLAIGAAPRRVTFEFFRHGLTVSAIGMAIGIPLALAGVRIVEAGLVGFTVRSVVAIGLIVAVLLAVAALASWLPARRAGRVDPLIALQAE